MLIHNQIMHDWICPVVFRSSIILAHVISMIPLFCSLVNMLLIVSRSILEKLSTINTASLCTAPWRLLQPPARDLHGVLQLL